MLTFIFFGLLTFTTEVTINNKMVTHRNKDGLKAEQVLISEYGSPKVRRPLIIFGWFALSVFVFITAEGHEDITTKLHYLASLFFMLVAVISLFELAVRGAEMEHKTAVKIERIVDFFKYMLMIIGAGFLCKHNNGWVYGWLNLADYSEFIFIPIVILVIIIGLIDLWMLFIVLSRLLDGHDTSEKTIEDEPVDEDANTTGGLVNSQARSDDTPPAPAANHHRSRSVGPPDKKVKKAKAPRVRSHDDS